MDIIQFLVRDHDRLRRDKLEIRENLTTQELRAKIKKYIAHFELHESVEHRFLLAKLNSLPLDKAMLDLVDDYEKDHWKIWSLVEELMDVVDHHESNSVIQGTFFKFIAFIESHVGREERLFFPSMQLVMDKETLNELGEKAERYYGRYFVET